MNARISLLAVAALVVATAAGRGETPIQPLDKADLVVVGKVWSLRFKESKPGEEGVRFRWFAEVIVTAVERGKGAKIGEKLNVRWSEVVKKPGREMPSPSGYTYRMKADDIVRFRLMKDGRDWTIINNPKGVKILK
jgi:hypothetical protein